MNKALNPILNFRKKSINKTTEPDNLYNLKIGGRVDSSMQLLIELSQYDEMLLSTLITETREAVDSSENS